MLQLHTSMMVIISLNVMTVATKVQKVLIPDRPFHNFSTII